MDIVKAIVFFTIIAFDVFIPARSISRTSYDYASKPQVLGENTKIATPTSEIKRAIMPKPIELRPTPTTRSSEIANIYRNLEMNIRAIQNSSDSAKEEKIKKIKAEYLKLINGKQGQMPTSTSEAKSNFQNREAEMEKIKKEKELFKSQVETIQNAKKKQTVLTISTKIASINKNVTDKMSTALDKLDTILKNLINQTSALKSDNKDTLSIETDTIDAQVALTEAQTEVLAQASKEYVLQISSNEATLKELITPAIVSLNKDINLTHQAVIKVKDAVIKIYKEIYELKLPTPTP